MNKPLYSFQKDALLQLEKDCHLVCISPTGSGKSRIYEEYLLKNKSQTAILISPLVALARQQRVRAAQLGFESRIQIVSPESLQYESHFRKLRELNPALLIVDEAHLVLEWGERFRPSFRKVFGLLKDLKIKKSLWLSATLTEEAIQDIESNIEGQIVRMGAFSFSQSVDIQKIKIPIAQRFEVLSQLKKFGSKQGVVFVATRSMATQIEKHLKIPSYHAGLSREERKLIEEKFYRQELNWIVATSAFGMGIDMPSLEMVVIFQVPFSLLTLVQMIGRVGRANKSGRALVLWSTEDFQLIANNDRQIFDALNSRDLRVFLEKSLGSYCHQAETC